MRTLLVVALALATTTAFAGLKEKPPKGHTLTGLWKLDPYRSDDPDAVLSQAHAEAASSGGEHSGGGMRGRRGGGGFPGGSGGGGGFPGGGGGGFPGGGGSRGGWGGGHHRGGESSDDSQGDAGTDGRTSARREMLQQLSKNPATLDFSTSEHTLKVSAEETNVECAAGVKVAISDSAGAAERNCGWDGRAWVIETDRAKVLKRTDRYELSKDGKTLTYTTTASGTRIPKLKITRTYVAAF